MRAPLCCFSPARLLTGPGRPTGHDRRFESRLGAVGTGAEEASVGRRYTDLSKDAIPRCRVPSPDTMLGRYADSQVRQMSGGSYGQHGVHQSSSRHDYGGADPRYPGSDAPGYSGSGTPAAAAANYPGYGNATPFSGPQYQGAYPPQAGDVRYATGAGTGPTMKLPYGATPDGWVSGGDLPTTQPQHPAQAPRQDYGMDTPMGDAQPMPTAWTQQYGAPGARQVYASQTQAGYGYATPAAAYQPQVPGAGPAYQQSTDPYYGRGPFSGATPTTQPYSDTIASPAVNPGYSPAPDQTQYDEPMGAQAHPAAAVAGAPAQLPQVPNPGRRERDRGGERERDSHDRQRDRERDRDRGDRDRDRDHRPERGEDGQRRKAHHYGRS